jgi:hypothetical protein
MKARKTFVAIVSLSISTLLFASTAYAHLSDVSFSSYSYPETVNIGDDVPLLFGISGLGTSSQTVEVNYYLSRSDRNELDSDCEYRIHLKKVSVNISPGHNYNLRTTLTIPETHRNASSSYDILPGPWYILMVATVNPFDTNTSACDGSDSYSFAGHAKAFRAIPITLLEGSNGNCGSNQYSGFLSGTGDTQIQPNGTWFYNEANGTYTGKLTGPDGTDFDLYLFKLEGGTWNIVSYSESNSSNEFINYTGSSGYFFWLVKSYNGSGSYNLCMDIL